LGDPFPTEFDRVAATHQRIAAITRVLGRNGVVRIAAVAQADLDRERNIGNCSPQAFDEQGRVVGAQPLFCQQGVGLQIIEQAAVAATLLHGAFAEYSSVELPEELNLELASQRLGGDAVYIERSKLQSIEGESVLRYDLTLPLLLNTRWQGTPQRLFAAGKVYRREVESTTHLEAFHQLELFAIDERGKFDAWAFAGRIFDAVDRVLPRAELRVTPTHYPMCARAWSLDVLRDGEWVEVLAWGEYANWVLKGIGADPASQLALGAGVGLERLAALKYSIDDIRKMSAASLI